MKKFKMKSNISIIIAIGAIVLLFSLYFTWASSIQRAPQAVAGSVDLSKWDFTKQGIVFLNGEWDFYPNVLLQPNEIPSNKVYEAKVPGSWNSKNIKAIQSARGNATYHIRINMPELSESVALKIHNIWMAHKLFINGVEVKQMGTPALLTKDYVPCNTPYIITINPEQTLDIVIQVSNYVYYTGGIIHPIQLGTEHEIDIRNQLSFGLDTAGFLLFLIFGIYHLNMYMMRKKESTYFYSGLFLICMSMTIITTREKILMQINQTLPFYFAYKMQDLFYVSLFVMLAFFVYSLNERLILKKILYVGVMPIVIYIVLVILTPYDFYTSIKPYINLYINIGLPVILCIFVYLFIIRKNKRMPSYESVCVLLCVLCIAILAVDTTLYFGGLIYTNLVSKIAVTLFLLIFNLFLSNRFTIKLNEVEILSENLQKANDIKDEFLIRTSHELKIPLSGISSIASHLLKTSESSLSEEKKNELVLIVDTSDKLSILVNDLVDVISLRHEDIKLNLTTVDLYVAVQLVFQLLSFDLKSKNVALINKIRPMTFVEVDENRLRQILYNISSNAINYTSKGKIEASVCEKEKFVIFTLSDTGMGIPQDEWENVFEDSYQSLSQNKNSDEGLGLGLYISRGLARKMHGDIWISNSVVGKGTDVSMSLPKGANQKVIPVSDYLYNNNLHTLKTSHDGSSCQTGKTIMIVDDEPTNIRVLSMILEEKYQIIPAYSAEEAIDILKSRKVNLVIIDMIMPGMSGIELTEKIRTKHSLIDMPIIISSVMHSYKDIELAFKSGANDYITKPFSQDEIQSRVKILIQLTDTMEKSIKNEMAFLQAQIKPHFIYNALSNIVSLCYEDGEKAANLVSMLSKYLRYILQLDQSSQIIPLRQELDIIDAYVEIERVRLGEKLNYRVYIDKSLIENNMMIPALLIQPLIENAIRHGIFNKQGEATVMLTITEGSEFIKIFVEDNGIGMSDEQIYEILHGKKIGGVGIKNIQKRIESLPNANFIIDSEPDKGTKCSIFLSKDWVISLPKESE